jgi:L-threonylcarbamoyladenylate synthase
MKILEITADNILAASLIIKKGGLVIYPTDTVYGLGCDPFNIKAVKKISSVKGARKKPLPMLVSDIKYVNRIADLSDKARKIVMKLWPGALTLVLPKKNILPDIVTCNLNSVGVRMPLHDSAIQFIRQSGGLLIGTSANITGEKPARTINEITEQLRKKVDLILDGGPTPSGKSSTVVDLTSEKLKILREGPISLNDIINSLKN